MADISGAMVKAMLIASADWMDCSGFDDFIGPNGEGDCPFSANLTLPYRFNNEQGYGRIQLDNALKLESWPASPTGTIVADGGLIAGGGVNHLGGSISGTINAVTGGTQSATFEVCDDTRELRVALVWRECLSATTVTVSSDRSTRPRSNLSLSAVPGALCRKNINIGILPAALKRLTITPDEAKPLR